MIAPRPRAAVPPQPVALEKLLLVEGETPAHFFEAALKEIGLASEVEIRSYGGISQLAGYLGVLGSTAEFKAKVRSVGVVRDAEDDPAAARRAVEAAVRGAGLAPAVKVAIAILPDDNTAGMIETLCVRTVDSTPLFECVSQFLTCAEDKGAVLPQGPIRAKHQVQAYLATLPNPQMMPGLAAYKGAWPFSHAAFAAVRAFLLGL